MLLPGKEKETDQEFSAALTSRLEVVNAEFGEGYLAWLSDFLRGTGLLVVCGRSTWRFAMGGTQKVKRN